MSVSLPYRKLILGNYKEQKYKENHLKEERAKLFNALY